MSSSDQQHQAFWIAYLTLVRTLHEEGVLPVQKIVNNLGQRLDADKQKFREKTNPFAKVMYESLLSLESVLIDPEQSDASGEKPHPDTKQ